MKIVRNLLACSALALSACGTDPAPVPVDAATPPVDVTTPGCYTEMGAANLCPMPRAMQADAMRPSFRLTHIKITAPSALASAILGNVVNSAVHTGGFLWGVTFDSMGNMARTGALNAQMITRGTVGQGLFDGRFRYYADNAPMPAVDGGMPPAANRWNPLAATTTAMGGRITTGMFPGTVRLPIFDTSGGLTTELPLEQAQLTNVQVPMDGGCIGLAQVSGGRFNECSSAWATSDGMMMPYGTVTAVINANAARSVNVSALSTTLCNLLSGSNCDATPQAMWTRQPDVGSGDTAGYRLTAEFAAVSARID